MRTRKLWTPAEVQLLAELYPMTPMAEICQRLNRSTFSIYGQVDKQGFKRHPDFFLTPAANRLDGKRGAAHRFPKGNVPYNKGRTDLKGHEPTYFQPGHLPHNTKADGHITIRCDGYKWIRLGLKKWKELHRHIWEEANGPIPRGYVVKFKDGNKDNCTLDNLHLCTMRENMQHNTIHNYPPELKQTIRTLSKLKKIINHATEQDNRPAQSPL